jgi:hypothetical protein
MAATIDQIQSIADLGAKILSLQLSIAEKTPEEALPEKWALRYCFGAFDGLAGRYNLDQYTDGLAVLTIGFAMLAGNEQGATYLGQRPVLAPFHLFTKGLVPFDFCSGPFWFSVV